MKFVFRADASLEIGTGHVMRCLTLASELSARGADCEFICRKHEGCLVDYIRNRGFITHVLPMGASLAPSDGDLAHATWLGTTQTEDAQSCATILAILRPDWLIVDHYALDANWECALAPYYGKLMVIDDLADRSHACDLLLDQTFGRHEEDYRPLVPAAGRLLCGSQYALLRPEFAALRSYSLQRRAKPELRELLISMGGVDKDNATGRVLQALCSCSLPAGCRITVVMGSTAPWLDDVCTLARKISWPTRVLIGVTNMAKLMADSDLAIGAAGATSWERCCLGLPSIALALADNQHLIISRLEEYGALGAIYVPDESLPHQLYKLLKRLCEPQTAKLVSERAASVTEGKGVAIIGNLIHV